MQTFLFYTPATQDAYTTTHIADVLSDCQGFEWESAWQGDYRSGLWTDAATGATCFVDVGKIPFAHDDAHAEKQYEHWKQNTLVVKIPLSSPHWHGVESLRFIQSLLDQLSGIACLDTEDTGDDEDEAGPGPLDRMRCLASWERLHVSQTNSRDDCYRMSRVSSVALWRYRRATAELDCDWPQALVLLDKDVARSAVVWDEPEEYIIVPPVELAVLKTATNTKVIDVGELISRADHVNNLDCAGAVKIPMSDQFNEIIDACVKMDLGRFKFLTDSEWSD